MKSILSLRRHAPSDDSKKNSKSADLADKEKNNNKGSKKRLRFPSFKRVSKRASNTLKLTPIDKSGDARAGAKGTETEQIVEKRTAPNTISIQGRTLMAAAEDATLSGRSHDEDSVVEEAPVQTESKQVDIAEVAFLQKESSKQESASRVEEGKSTEEFPDDEAEQDHIKRDDSLVEEVQVKDELESLVIQEELPSSESDAGTPAVFEEECPMEAHLSDKEPLKAGIPSIIQDRGPVEFIESLSTGDSECQSARNIEETTGQAKGLVIVDSATREKETINEAEGRGFRIVPRCSRGVPDDENDATCNEWDLMGIALLAGASSMTFLRSGRSSTIAALIGTTAVMGTFWIFQQRRRINAQKDEHKGQ